MVGNDPEAFLLLGHVKLLKWNDETEASLQKRESQTKLNQREKEQLEISASSGVPPSAGFSLQLRNKTWEWPGCKSEKHSYTHYCIHCTCLDKRMPN